jgi:hypothetical protein
MPPHARALLNEYSMWQRKQGYRDTTIRPRVVRLKTFETGCAPANSSDIRDLNRLIDARPEHLFFPASRLLSSQICLKPANDMLQPFLSMMRFT